MTLLKRCLQTQPFDSGDPDCKTVLDQLYRAYAESHEIDPPEISDGFRELEAFLEHLPLNDKYAEKDKQRIKCRHKSRFSVSADERSAKEIEL